jgi:predicted HTH transcriptional regulator
VALAKFNLKSTGRITNADYQNLVGGSRRTALGELEGLVQHGVLALRGKGRGSQLLPG